MKEMGLYGITPKIKNKSYKGDMNCIVKNLLLEKVIDEETHRTYYERCFEITGVNQKWTTDVLEFHNSWGKLYLSPNQKERYHKALKEKWILQSMSRKENCYDNEVMKNFFAKMNNEMFYGHEYKFQSLEQLKKKWKSIYDIIIKKELRQN